MNNINLEKKKAWERNKTIRIQNKRLNTKVKNLKGEVWYDIPKYEGLYQISSKYRVKRVCRWVVQNTHTITNGKKLLSERIISPSRPKNSYCHFSLSKNGVKKTEGMHRLVAVTFIPNPDSKPCVNHKNGIKSDNRVENLEWCTESENGVHKCRVLGKCIGDYHGNCTIPYSIVCEIREKYKRHKYDGEELSKKYKISKTTLSMIINNKTRKNA